MGRSTLILLGLKPFNTIEKLKSLFFFKQTSEMKAVISLHKYLKAAGFRRPAFLKPPFPLPVVKVFITLLLESDILTCIVFIEHFIIN